MRFPSLLAVLILHLPVLSSLSGADAIEELSLAWQAPFTTLSAEQKTDKLVLMLVTNDDAFPRSPQAAPVAKDPDKAAKADAVKPLDHAQHGWCAAEFHHTCQRILRSRPDLKDRISLQSIFAGMPLELNGGAASNSPARVLLLVCDSTYSLLGLTVGLPDAEHLLTLLEDAEEVKLLHELNESNLTQITAAILQRNEKRLDRLWKMRLQTIVKAKDQEDALIADGAAEPPSSLMRLQKLFLAWQPTYTYDVQTRFGLSTKLDKRRLVILEQHTEARDPWCQAVTPFMAGMDIQKNWNLIAELLWQQIAIPTGSDQTDFLTWFDEHKKTGTFILAIKSPSHLEHLPWPPTKAPKSRRGTSWQTAHDAAAEFPFHTITPQQLTELVRQRDLKPINFFSPSMIRYLLVSQSNRLPQIIREQDPPARFWGLLKRAKKADKSDIKPMQKEEI
jgi:hypothetical protein